MRCIGFWRGVGLPLGIAVLAGCNLDPSDAEGSSGMSFTDSNGEGEDTGGDSEFGPEQEFELRLNEVGADPLVLDMDKAEVEELFGDVAGEILLLEIDSTALLTNILNEIRDACGTAWQQDNDDPNHNCNATALGQTFRGPDNTWQTSAEYALVRILTMTPANAVVEGTSINGLQDLSDGLEIGGGYSQLLSEILGIPRTEAIVTTPFLVESMQEGFLGSHPNMPEDGSYIPVTLEDALADLGTLNQKLGPSGPHPGVVAPDFDVVGEIFGPDFNMHVEGDSNLQLLDGVDLSSGKDFISVIVDNIGPTFEDEVEFDFSDPEKFTLSGIVEDQVVDLRFRIDDHPTFVDSCSGANACQQNLPNSPVGQNSVWALGPWFVEWIIAGGAYEKYKTRQFEGSWALGLAKVFVGRDGDPPGWARFDIIFDLGSPPGDQYLWEVINEVAQVALHKTDFATYGEGQADVEFTMFDVGVGIKGSEAEQAVRPFLQEQASDVSDYLLGDYKKNNGDIDFYYRLADDDNTYMFFIAPEDQRDDQTYDYPNPGFYSDPDLSDKASALEIGGVGDTSHEKVRIDEGETVLYLQDGEGRLFRLRVFKLAGEDDVTVYVSEAE